MPSSESGSLEAVVVLPDGVKLSQAAAVTPKPTTPKKAPASSPAQDSKSIVHRLRKLKVKDVAGAINSIKAMFQFNDPKTDAQAEALLRKAQRDGLVEIASSGKVTLL
jgi:hypothetical protein